MASTPPPFAPFEWMIAWRYLRARRAEGGVSVMTWISLVGITLAVFALIATLAVRSGFRAEFVDTILGANAHVTVYAQQRQDDDGRILRTFPDYTERAERVAEVPGVTRVAPLVKGQVMATANSRNAGVEVFGIAADDLRAIPRIADPETGRGTLDDFGVTPEAPPLSMPEIVEGDDVIEDDIDGGEEAETIPFTVPAATGIAIGSGVARELGVGVGDEIKLISPDGVRTAFGVSPRVKTYPVSYIFTAGRYDIDRTRVYMPFDEAQLYFNREGVADELEVMTSDPERVEDLALDIQQAAGTGAIIWTWQDASGAFLRALEVEDNVMFVILSVLVLIATMNIVSGLIMLVKNKGRDIGILRTMGLTEGSVLRVFFICGAFTGVIGTVMGVALGCLFAIYIDPIFSFVNYVSGGGVWDPAVRGIYSLPAKLQLQDVASAMALSLGLSFVVTIFPARRAARMNPVEALRYE
ncbi:ABC transporter permease [Citreicella sp. C3M06]|uniref:ABC transporter permease n=1 Tax=Citreicella sp. C3M06 TaxID=2841564 RepID=UPI001C081E30|nr:ABC transporter permease [Citreicella sp. C3M06]MBU2959604.1 ABC transporter permease [Citreicella sp. C3M06]